MAQKLRKWLHADMEKTAEKHLELGSPAGLEVARLASYLDPRHKNVNRFLSEDQRAATRKAVVVSAMVRSEAFEEIARCDPDCIAYLGKTLRDHAVIEAPSGSGASSSGSSRLVSDGAAAQEEMPVGDVPIAATPKAQARAKAKAAAKAKAEAKAKEKAKAKTQAQDAKQAAKDAKQAEKDAKKLAQSGRIKGTIAAEGPNLLCETALALSKARKRQAQKQTVINEVLYPDDRLKDYNETMQSLSSQVEKQLKRYDALPEELRGCISQPHIMFRWWLCDYEVVREVSISHVNAS